MCTKAGIPEDFDMSKITFDTMDTAELAMSLIHSIPKVKKFLK